MFREMLKSKIHRACVRQADLHYVGSITIDERLMEYADIVPGEKVDVANISNGARFSTYVLKGQQDSGVIGINGASARLVSAGDLIIILSYLIVADEMALNYVPRIVHVDAENRPISLGRDPAEIVPGSGDVRGDTLDY
jgi:aspartate 1-decarboxylase